MPVKEILPDGTRVYTKGHRYKPLELHERKYRKFPPGTKWFGGKPFGPLPVLPDDERVMPGTISDNDAARHPLGHPRCRYCKVERVRRLKRERIKRESR